MSTDIPREVLEAFWYKHLAPINESVGINFPIEELNTTYRRYCLKINERYGSSLHVDAVGKILPVPKVRCPMICGIYEKVPRVKVCLPAFYEIHQELLVANSADAEEKLATKYVMALLHEAIHLVYGLIPPGNICKTYRELIRYESVAWSFTCSDVFVVFIRNGKANLLSDSTQRLYDLWMKMGRTSDHPLWQKEIERIYPRSDNLQ